MESVRSVRLGAIRMETALRAQRAPVDLRAPTGRAQCARMHRRRTPARRRASRARRLMQGREASARRVLRGASQSPTRQAVRSVRLDLRALAASVCSVCLGTSQQQTGLHALRVMRGMLVLPVYAWYAMMDLRQTVNRRCVSFVVQGTQERAVYAHSVVEESNLMEAVRRANLVILATLVSASVASVIRAANQIVSRQHVSSALDQQCRL